MPKNTEPSNGNGNGNDTGNGYGCDAFRANKHGDIPTPDEVARGILSEPAILTEIFRLLSWTDPERLKALAAESLTHRADVLKSCENGTFGRDFVIARTSRGYNRRG